MACLPMTIRMVRLFVESESEKEPCSYAGAGSSVRGPYHSLHLGRRWLTKRTSRHNYEVTCDATGLLQD